MLMNEKNGVLSKSKRIVLNLAIVLIVFLIICTFVSRSIYVMLLPKVEVASVETTSLLTQSRVRGKLYYSNEERIIAKTNANVVEIFVKQGDTVKKGDKLFAVDSSDYSIRRKRLELNVLNIENQLKPTELTPAQRSETQAQLDIAKKEYELMIINKNISRSISDGEYALERLKYREQSKLTQAQLTAAYEQLHDLISNGTPPSGYDALESQYRAAVIQAENNVLLLDDEMSESEKNSARVEYDLAQKRYRQYLHTDDIKVELLEQKLNLDILRYENMLNPQEITAAQRAERNLSLEIAREELNNFKASNSPDGTVTATDDGEVIGIGAQVMVPVNVGDTLLTYRKNAANLCVKWEMSFEAGINLSERSEILVTFEKQADEINFFSGEETQTLKADSIQYDEKTNTWQASARLQEFDGKIQAGSMVDIVINTHSDGYFCVVPLASLNKTSEYGYSVMKVLTRNGLFSEETYVEEIVVELLEQDNFSAAIKADMLMPQDKVVKYSSEPLKNGTVIYLQ